MYMLLPLTVLSGIEGNVLVPKVHILVIMSRVGVECNVLSVYILFQV
jgi:hypothetical protein